MHSFFGLSFIITYAYFFLNANMKMMLTISDSPSVTVQDSHIPFSPMSHESRKSIAVRITKVLIIERKADKPPFENAVNKADAKALKPTNRDAGIANTRPISVRSKNLRSFIKEQLHHRLAEKIKCYSKQN